MLRGLLAAALLVPARAAVGGRHSFSDKPQAQLRPSAAAQLAAAPQAPEVQGDALLRHRFASGLGIFHVPGEIAAGEEDKKSAKEDKDKEESGQPVQMQVPEGELKNLSAKLTPECQTQFTDILHGKSLLHTFGDSGVQSEGECKKMNGSLCSMNAHLTQTRDTQGRQMKSTTHVSGDSCLPEQCMASNDLKVLADFMKLKAQDMLVGADVAINLRVDCSKSGGSIANVGPGAEPEPVASSWHSAATRLASCSAAAMCFAAAGVAAASSL